MAKPRTEWTPHPHDPIEMLAENLWWVRAPVPGFSINRTMTLVRLDDGRLVMFNAVALEEELEKLSKIPDLVRLIVGHDSVAHGPAARAGLQSAAQQMA